MQSIDVKCTNIPMVVQVIVEERSDVETIRGILEILFYSVNGHDEEMGEGIGNAAAKKALEEAAQVNAEIFAQDERNIPLILGLLDDEAKGGISDFYVRYHAIKIMTALMSTNAWKLQAAVLASPMGVVKLMDLLSEGEIVRNETILLLVGLTDDNAEIQKLAAFEGVFDHISNIIREEGNAEGGIIVQDCLELLCNLFRGNSSNQLLFRESGHMSKLEPLLTITDNQLGNQTGKNMFCALESIILLVKPPSCTVADQKLMQTLLFKVHNFANMLIKLTVSESAVQNSTVRGQALKCLAALIAGHAENKEYLANQQVEFKGELIPALHAFLMVALNANESFESGAACELIELYCLGNIEGQTLLASTIVPVSDDAKGPMSFGSTLLQAMITLDGDGKSHLASKRAATIMAFLLRDNTFGKEHILKLPMTLQSESVGEGDILSCFIRVISSAHDSTMAPLLKLSVLKTLIIWISDCKLVADLLLASPSHIPLLVDLLSTKDKHVAGMASVLLGLCVLASVEPANDKSFNSRTVVDVTGRHVGLHKFFCAWDDMMSSDEFKAGLQPPKIQRVITRNYIEECFQLNKEELTENEATFKLVYDSAFAAFVRDLQSKVREGVVQSYSNPLSDDNGLLNQPTSNNMDDAKLKSLQDEIKQLRARNESLATDLLAVTSSSTSGADSSVVVSKAQEDIAAREVDKKVASIQMSLNKAEETVQARDSKIKALESSLASSETQAEKFKADLKDLADAYNTLEEHSFGLESKLNEMTEKLNEKANTGNGNINEDKLQEKVEIAVNNVKVEFEKQLDTLQQSMQESVAQCNELKDKCLLYEQRELESQASNITVAKLEEEIQTLRRENGKLNSGMDQMLQDTFTKEQLNVEIEKATALLKQAHDDQLLNLENSLKGYQSECDRLKSQIHNSTDKEFTKEDVQTAIENARNEAAADADEEIYNLETKLRDLQTKLTQTESNQKAAGFSQEDLDLACKKAKEEAEAEADESMNDLLVCLGQEEKKTEILREKLEELGQDVDVMLEGLDDQEEEEEEEEED